MSRVGISRWKAEKLVSVIRRIRSERSFMKTGTWSTTLTYCNPKPVSLRIAQNQESEPLTIRIKIMKAKYITTSLTEYLHSISACRICQFTGIG